MKTTVKQNVFSYPYYLLLTGLLGLSGCAPVSPYPAPQQAYTPPAAMPLQQRPAQRRPPAQTYVPPALNPLPEQRQPVVVTRPAPISAAPRPTRIVPSPPARTVTKTPKPDVAYIPDRVQNRPSSTASTPSSTLSSTPSSTVTVTTKPFWEEEGKVEVEVVDLKKSTAPASTRNNDNDSDNAGNTSGSGLGSDTAVAGSISGASSSPAVLVLMKQANNELVAGKADRAATTLERALRIAPNDANLWLRLAEVNYQQGNKGQAASMAKKAMDLSPNDASLRQRSQRLLN